jgi:Protein of unknown function (DUF2568)
MAWVVLTLVFADELLALVAFGVWGQHRAAWWLAVLAPAVAILAWWLFAAPKAPYGRFARLPVKLVVFGLAAWALWDAGYPGWSLAFMVLSVVVNGLAQLPSVGAAHPHRSTGSA